MKIANIFQIQPLDPIRVLSKDKSVNVTVSRKNEEVLRTLSNHSFAMAWAFAARTAHHLAYAGAQQLRETDNEASLGQALFLARMTVTLSAVSTLASNHAKVTRFINKVVFKKDTPAVPANSKEEKPDYHALSVAGLLLPGVASAGAAALLFSEAGVRYLTDICQSGDQSGGGWFSSSVQFDRCDNLMDTGKNAAIASVLLIASSLAVASAPALASRTKKIIASVRG